MYKNRNSRGGNPSRRSTVARSKRRSYSGSTAGKSHYKGKRKYNKYQKGAGKRGGRGSKQFSDISKFINKATPQAEVIPYDPKHTFDDFIIDKRLKENIRKAGYSHPTPIQDEAIPQTLLGRDIVGIANTGTGKTAAFMIPLLNKIIQNKREKVLIVAPTRELAIQINDEARKLSAGLNTFSVCVVGGMPIFRQIKDLRRHHNFVIGTPGRLKDLLKRKCIKLDEFQTIVLDEADRMLDMGFIGDMRFLMSAMTQKRHTLFFSATLSSEIKNLINEFLNNPVSITVKTGDTAGGVDQDVVYVKGDKKIDILHDLLIQPEFNKVLVFGKTKYGVEKLSKVLAKRGLKSISIHGNKNHSQRQRALKMFKDNSANVLVATDVAARGLDIPDVTHVINYELPATYEDYIHRVGRTGRSGKMGKALTFVEGRR